MRAAVVEAFGPFDGIEVKETEAPAAGRGEILLRVSVAGVNFADGGMVSGRAARKQPPLVPGVLQVFDWYASGRLEPRIGGEWPLEGVGEALTKITAGNTTGKLLIRV